jgi:hypothetical protein
MYPRLFLGLFRCAAWFALLASTLTVAYAQDVPVGVTYVCSGEHIYVENCNMRDTSDTSTCMVAHPDHLTPTGLNTYTYLTRGALKKLLPTCQQPSAKEVANAQAFKKKQQELYDAAVAKANPQPRTQPNPGQSGQPISVNTQTMTPEQRQMNRCITSGRLPSSCTGNSLLGAFSQMVSSVLPAASSKEAVAGPNMAGVFEGPGHWRLDFITDGVLVNCSFLSPNQQSYSIKFEADRTVLVIETTPRPLVLAFKADGTITGPGPVTIDGVIAGGYVNDTPSNATQKDQYGNLYDAAGNRVLGNQGGHTNFVPKRTTCPALNLSSKGAGTGIETMETDLLKTAFGGDKGPPTPPGIRMHGIFAASTGFSVQFFPESVIVGCGPDAARAYPYTVRADGAHAVIKVDTPDHLLALTFRSDGSLDPGSGSYPVHGRRIVGQDDNDNFTFAPYEQTCELATLTASKIIPSAGGTMTASASAPGNAPLGSAPPRVSAPTGPANATLSIVSGLPPQPGQPNPLAAHPYILLRSSFSDTVARTVAIPPDSSAHKALGLACANRTPDCQKIVAAIQADAAGSLRADANGGATFPAVPAGTYYLMISARVNNQPVAWEQAVQLHPGANTVTLDLRNAAAIN